MDRYFELTDESLKEALLDHHQLATDKVKTAAEFATKHGLGTPLWVRWGPFDHSLCGFRKTGEEPNPKALTKPDKDRCVRPRRSGKDADKSLSADYQALVKEVKLSEDPVKELLGWGSMTFMPTRPGYRCHYQFKKFFFIMPERVEELAGCVELTNVEYIARIKELEAMSDAEQQKENS